MNTSKGTERINKDGDVEIKVDAVDYRSPAGHTKEDKPEKNKVEVTHIIDPKGSEPASDHAKQGKPVSSKQDR